VVADTLALLDRMLPPPGACRRIEDRWADAAHAAKVDPALLTGDHLIHTDLNPHNILISQQAARVVDWAWPTLGAAWIDPACTALWLIADGYTPAFAEAWAATIPSWTLASPQALDVFIATNAALWADIAAADPRPWKQRLRDVATMWTGQGRHGETRPGIRLCDRTGRIMDPDDSRAPSSCGFVSAVTRRWSKNCVRSRSSSVGRVGPQLGHISGSRGPPDFAGQLIGPSRPER